MNLQQWESAAIYAAEFQRIAFKTEWEDVSLIMQFYRELKDDIKNNITKTEQSEMLQVMIKLAVQIDNQQHKWCMKRTKLHAPVIVMQRKSTTLYHDSYGLQSMNLDTTHRHSEQFKRTECFQKRGTSSHFKREECYNCDISGHFTQECQKQRKSQSITTIK